MANGPGGRIAPDGRTPQAPGVGANAKRHDLERQPTPGLEDSDLQVGDVGELEAGQRVQPIKEQAPATRGPTPKQSTAAPETGPGGGPPDVGSIIENRLAGTFTPDTQVGLADQDLQRRAQTWLNFLSHIAESPGASPMLRARITNEVKRQVQDGAFNTRGGALFPEDAADALEALQRDRP